MPKLKRLEINTPGICFDHRDPLFAKSLFILPKLRTIKINWSSASCGLNFFERLHEIMPVLKDFYFNMNDYSFHKDFFHNFIYHWWPIFEKKEQINIFLKWQSLRIAIDHNIQIYSDKFQSDLLAMNEEYNGRVKIEWTEKSCRMYTSTEISICKFSS
jgi:hypothetical protein